MRFFVSYPRFFCTENEVTACDLSPKESESIVSYVLIPIGYPFRTQIAVAPGELLFFIESRCYSGVIAHHRVSTFPNVLLHRLCSKSFEFALSSGCERTNAIVNDEPSVPMFSSSSTPPPNVCLILYILIPEDFFCHFFFFHTILFISTRAYVHTLSNFVYV